MGFISPFTDIYKERKTFENKKNLKFYHSSQYLLFFALFKLMYPYPTFHPNPSSMSSVILKVLRLHRMKFGISNSNAGSMFDFRANS